MSPVNPLDDAATARAVVDDDGVVLEWNDGAVRLLGYGPDEVVGRPASELCAVEGGCEGLLAPLSVERRTTATVSLRHRDGRTVPVGLIGHRRPPRAGRPGHWLLVAPVGETSGPLRPDDPLAVVELVQSPCATAVFDTGLRLRAMNADMARVLGAPADRLRGLRVTDIGARPELTEVEQAMRQVLETGEHRSVRVYIPQIGGSTSRAWLTSMAPVRDDRGEIRGVSLASHDFTEQLRARERLELVNEASTRVGTTLDVRRTAQEFADVLVPALADHVSVDLLDPEDGGDPPSEPPPPTVPVRLRRVADRSVVTRARGLPDVGELAAYPATTLQAESLSQARTLVVTDTPQALARRFAYRDGLDTRAVEVGMHSAMAVPLRARGMILGVALLTRHRQQEPFSRDDVLLAEEVAATAAVGIDNARRYSREREVALALQRSLLPRSLPITAALQAASRYLPAARAGGVGGDWFDIIPLSGMRVAMVVGDVVGHGVQASATMGRLRTAVRTLADIDLAPDELLTHLDDLVVRLSEEAGNDGSPGEVGATCLYAVYDPVSRRCSLARAGHQPPLMVLPGGLPEPVEMPAGPPLGVGGLPFEAAELDLPEGTVLAFYTDGLVMNRGLDVDAGRVLLQEALAEPAASLDESCEQVLATLLPRGDVADDVALLLARTRGLPASKVATWDIPADPALVAAIRKQAVKQLDHWGLEDAAFTAELVVSELVTNAIRYGARPIRLRLIHGSTTLICEVSDTSHTAPHLRRARTFDEGGRGLLLVAQLTQRWGTRHTPDGKTIWAELALLDEA
ncbi:SpoIIE family protein phosphatase [Streptomyces sp. MJP52]|uniref:SpoIIE family protein phosphatase n=1 Tax=Streptomyces sp. MJP52 TaxID=2940555 RepID=UPI0024740797|nr:SpoIIE family protein phosphatase [Streptomyces sp. MJP52]MDH6228708.1 PAS domain S-box-containing protein [Streptomyces sp. MJP52]